MFLFLDGWTQFKYTFRNEIPRKNDTQQNSDNTHNNCVCKPQYLKKNKIEDKREKME